MHLELGTRVSTLVFICCETRQKQIGNHFSSVSLLASETEKCPEANSFERDENFASESVSRMSEKLVDVKPGIFKILLVSFCQTDINQIFVFIGFFCCRTFLIV